MKFRDQIETSSGLGKFIHFLTWPIRRFYIVIPIVTLLLATPIFFGVKVTEMKDWYKDKTAYVIDEAPDFFAGYYNKIKGLLGFEVDNENLTTNTKGKSNIKSNTIQKRGIDTLVDAPKRIKSSKRKGFNVGNSDIQRIAVEVEGGEIIETTELNDIVVYSDVERITSGNSEVIKTILNSSEPEAFVIKPSAKKLPLVYLKTTKTIMGEAIIKNANELEIDGTYIVLYGVYVKPNTLRGAQARAYLETKARRNDIKCTIVAYTYQNIATAVCFAGKENLNRSLVDNEYSDNIALD